MGNQQVEEEDRIRYQRCKFLTSTLASEGNNHSTTQGRKPRVGQPGSGTGRDVMSSCFESDCRSIGG